MLKLESVEPANAGYALTEPSRPASGTAITAWKPRTMAPTIFCPSTQVEQCLRRYTNASQAR